MVIIIGIAIQGCGNGNKAANTWTNDDIDAEIKKQVSPLNDKLFNAIMASDVNTVRSMLSPTLLQKAGGKIDTLVNSTGKSFNAKAFDVKDEYYTKHHVKKDPDTLLTQKGSDDDYMVTYRAMNEEMYTSVLVSQNLPINCLILVVYGKYGNDWKINILQIGEYTIDGKNSQAFYKLAQKYYDGGDLLDAANMLVLTSQLANPAGDFFKYRNEDTLKNFYAKVMEDANKIYNFPYPIRDIKTIPQIFSITPEFVADKGQQGVYPMIKYRSTIKLTDAEALKAENRALQAIIGKVFPGILQNNPFILYKAYNSTPDGKVPGDNYNFIQKTSN
ncbi:hypothetical protein [Mucilaginibacter antarcticus]|uniref:hypothetical protein n=1 Tax=Mucilaginibacter antarcticus TaxID=1855725 RepID=UPI0036281F86